MRLVVDANVVISALAKDSAVRAALRTATDDVVTPWYIHVEIEEHHTEIRQKSGLSSQAFDALLEEVGQLVEVVPRQVMRPHLHQAARTMQHSIRPIRCTSRLHWRLKGPSSATIRRSKNRAQSGICGPASSSSGRLAPPTKTSRIASESGAPA